MYNMEIKASLQLIDEYESMNQYLNRKFNGKRESTIRLCLMHGSKAEELDVSLT